MLFRPCDFIVARKKLTGFGRYPVDIVDGVMVALLNDGGLQRHRLPDHCAGLAEIEKVDETVVRSAHQAVRALRSDAPTRIQRATSMRSVQLTIYGVGGVISWNYRSVNIGHFKTSTSNARRRWQVVHQSLSFAVTLAKNIQRLVGSHAGRRLHRV